MLKPILFFFLLISAVYANAQSNNNLILVKYKDGATYLGQKLSEEDGIIRIKLKNRDKMLVENKQDIIHVDRRGAWRIYDDQNATVFENGKFHTTKGFFMTMQWGIGFGFYPSAQFNLSADYRVNNKITAGLGAGIQANDTSIGGLYLTTRFVGIYGQGRYYLTHKKRRVYATGNLGYGIGLGDPFGLEGSNATGGLKAGAGLGVSFASRRSSKYFLELENYFQKGSGLNISEDNLGNNVLANYDLWFKRIVLKLGVDL